MHLNLQINTTDVRITLIGDCLVRKIRTTTRTPLQTLTYLVQISSPVIWAPCWLTQLLLLINFQIIYGVSHRHPQYFISKTRNAKHICHWTSISSYTANTILWNIEVDYLKAISEFLKTYDGEWISTMYLEYLPRGLCQFRHINKSEYKLHKFTSALQMRNKF